MIDELRRAANANLAYLRSPQAARDRSLAEERRDAIREEKKADKRRLKSLARKIPQLQAEADGLRAYLDEVLLAEDPEISPDEVDHALSGCEAELRDLTEELKSLEGKTYV